MKELVELKQLQVLVLIGNDVTDSGLKELSQLKQLHTLVLANTKVTDAGLKELAGLKQLRTLSLQGTQVTEVGVRQLQQSLPELKVYPPTTPRPAATIQKKADSPKWEFKAVSFSNDEKESTKKLNDLADEAWEYVGPLGQRLVAFRRPYVRRDQIILEVVGNPKTVTSGEKTTITVTVRAGDRSLLPGAKVTISAGGGKFLPKADTPFDPKDRLHAPYSATGTSDEKGKFTTWWVVNPAAAGYVLNINASKQGFTTARAEHRIPIKR
jgi:hypothetical protein